jgi:hypothetical protein
MKTLLAMSAALAIAGADLAIAQSAEEQAVLAIVNRMFEGMRTSDSAMVRSTFATGARFAMLDTRSTPPRITYDSINGWLGGIARSNRRWDEQIYDVQARVDLDIAQVWAPYTFYLDKKVVHCGVDIIQLLKLNGEWKVTQLSDSRRREGCPDPLAKKG